MRLSSWLGEREAGGVVKSEGGRGRGEEIRVGGKRRRREAMTEIQRGFWGGKKVCTKRERRKMYTGAAAAFGDKS